METISQTRQRLDQWLWHARLFKSRSLAKSAIEGGALRVDGNKVTRASQLIGSESVCTLRSPVEIKVFKILTCAKRRGPASEAQALYELINVEKIGCGKTPHSNRVGKRPTKKERRRLDQVHKVT